MATIEERAKKAWATYEYREGCLYSTTFKDGYILGATEQRTIDIDKACGALDDVYFPSEESREKAKQIVRKAMEEEL